MRDDDDAARVRRERMRAGAMVIVLTLLFIVGCVALGVFEYANRPAPAPTAAPTPTPTPAPSPAPTPLAFVSDSLHTRVLTVGADPVYNHMHWITFEVDAAVNGSVVFVLEATQLTGSTDVVGTYLNFAFGGECDGTSAGQDSKFFVSKDTSAVAADNVMTYDNGVTPPAIEPVIVGDVISFTITGIAVSCTGRVGTHLYNFQGEQADAAWVLSAAAAA